MKLKNILYPLPTRFIKRGLHQVNQGILVGKYGIKQAPKMELF